MHLWGNGQLLLHIKLRNVRITLTTVPTAKGRSSYDLAVPDGSNTTAYIKAACHRFETYTATPPSSQA